MAVLTTPIPVADPEHAEDWRNQALCAQTDPEAFFPEKGGSVREAKRICNRCEVTAECLNYALSIEPAPVGVWGALTVKERNKVKRQRRNARQVVAK